jgi:hypothetical protein
VNSAGLVKLREMIAQRILRIDPQLVHRLDSPMDGVSEVSVFDNADTLEQLCLMSGGHVRMLMQLIQKAIDWTDALPITAQAARRAAEETRETYKLAIQDHHWGMLASVCHSKTAKNNEQYLGLLLNRCLLEYRYYDEEETLQIWCNVHPLIEGLKTFQEALSKVQSQ